MHPQGPKSVKFERAISTRTSRTDRPYNLDSSSMEDRKTARSRNGQLVLETAQVSAPERDTLQMRVYRALGWGLMAGSFKPGEAVSLRTLGRHLGTSPMPVREAVSRLIAERALVLLPNRSVIVPRMSRDRFIELSRARQMLEGTLTQAACAHGTPALLNRLIKNNDALKRCLAGSDYHNALKCNLLFHFTLYRSGPSQVILPLVEMLWRQAGPFLALALDTTGVQWTARHHAAVIAALRAKNAQAARKAIESDIEETLRQLLKKASFEGDPKHEPPGMLDRKPARRRSEGG